MRIGFLGKGGSGKTTLSSAFAWYLSSKGHSTWFVDADVNMHSNLLFNLPKDQIRPLSQCEYDLMTYVYGQRPDTKDIPRFTQIPPNNHSPYMTLSDSDPFVSSLFTRVSSNLHFASIGTYGERDVGYDCYHSKCAGFELLLNHLRDESDQYMVIDSVTGIDNVGTSLIHSYDLNFLVVEPTSKSIQVYQDFVTAVGKLPFAVSYKVVVNKVMDENDKAFVLQSIPQDQIVAWVPELSQMAAVDQGQVEKFPELVAQLDDVFAPMVEVLSGYTLDREQYRKNIRQTFEYNAQQYYNDYYQVDYAAVVQIPFTYSEWINDASSKNK